MRCDMRYGILGYNKWCTACRAVLSIVLRDGIGATQWVVDRLQCSLAKQEELESQEEITE